MLIAARLACAVALALFPALASAQIAHQLQVELNPGDRKIRVTDTVVLPAGQAPAEFTLHAGLRPVLVDTPGELTLLRQQPGAGGVTLERYALTLPVGTDRFVLRYDGEIHHPVAQSGEAYGRGFGVTPGVIAPEGVYLNSASHWYPSFADAQVTFNLQVRLPNGWRSMSQGRRTRREESGGVVEDWRIHSPQDQIFLIAGAFTEYTRPAGAVRAMVLLREPEPDLAALYLEATGRYIEMYQRLIGPYPYEKFALVENFWETGYGMPSFTLLGPRVIRLPFILNSSYPHEILHNWWGNGVYVDYATGNWSEGLTTYLADHLVKEQHGQGAGYRRGVLQKYADYVQANQDFALREFRGRHNSVSEAIGYGKTMMVFHMLRRRLGDPAFTEGLRHLYINNRFRVTGFDDVEASFSAAAGQSLKRFFDQWVGRPGAPSLRVHEVEVNLSDGQYSLAMTLEQTQDADPYTLRVPLAIHVAGLKNAYQDDITVRKRIERVEIPLPGRPVWLEVDPEFDLFRRLDRAEIPPAISQALGAGKVLFVLPHAAPEEVRQAYTGLVETWRRGQIEFAVVSDIDLDLLPDDQTVWLFGWENRFRPDIDAALEGYGFESDTQAVQVEGVQLTRTRDAVVAVGRNPTHPQHALAWVAADGVGSIRTLARKLPHYGKYGYLGFRGEALENIAKGEWPVLESPMSLPLADDAGPHARLATRAALVEPADGAVGAHATREQRSSE